MRQSTSYQIYPGYELLEFVIQLREIKPTAGKGLRQTASGQLGVGLPLVLRSHHEV